MGIGRDRESNVEKCYTKIAFGGIIMKGIEIICPGKTRKGGRTEFGGAIRNGGPNAYLIAEQREKFRKEKRVRGIQKKERRVNHTLF